MSDAAASSDTRRPGSWRRRERQQYERRIAELEAERDTYKRERDAALEELRELRTRLAQDDHKTLREVAHQGGLYRGTLVDDLPHGSGVLYAMDGETKIYEGEWQDGTRHGQGKEFTDDKMTYKGAWADGEKVGDGEATGMQWERCCSYYGKTIDGKPHGEGELLQGESVIYRGRWKDGKRNGKGDEFVDGRLIYTGTWFCGKRTGRGAEFSQGGELIYEGSWHNGERTYRREGKVGGMELKGDQGELLGYYSGAIYYGRPHGEGELRDGGDNRVVYKGGWRNGMRHGHGKAYYHWNGPVLWFRGEWRHNRIHSGALFPDGNWSGEREQDGMPVFPADIIMWQGGEAMTDINVPGSGWTVAELLRDRGVSVYLPVGALG